MRSRRIIARHASTLKAVDLVTMPPRMSLWQRRREGFAVKATELVRPSDARSQRTSITLTERLAIEEIAASIGSVGHAYDNALVEWANGLYKTECIRSTTSTPGAHDRRMGRLVQHPPSVLLH